MRFVGVTHLGRSMSAEDVGVSAALSEGDVRNDACSSSLDSDLADPVGFFVDITLRRIVEAAGDHDLHILVIGSHNRRSSAAAQLIRARSKWPQVRFLTEENLDLESIIEDLVSHENRSPEPYAVFSFPLESIIASNFFETASFYLTDRNVGMKVLFNSSISANVISNEVAYIDERSGKAGSRIELEVHRLAPSARSTLSQGRGDGVKGGKVAPQLVAFNNTSHVSMQRVIPKALWKSFPVGKERRSESIDARLRTEFPDLPPVLITECYQQLVDSPIDLQSPVEIEFPFQMEAFSLDFSFDAPLAVDPKSVVVSYDLVDSKGLSISLDTDVPGVGKSSRREIGFCYFPEFTETVEVAAKHVQLPNGIYCKGITVRRWGSAKDLLRIIKCDVAFSLKRR